MYVKKVVKFVVRLNDWFLGVLVIILKLLPQMERKEMMSPTFKFTDWIASVLKSLSQLHNIICVKIDTKGFVIHLINDGVSPRKNRKLTHSGCRRVVSWPTCVSQSVRYIAVRHSLSSISFSQTNIHNNSVHNLFRGRIDIWHGHVMLPVSDTCGYCPVWHVPRVHVSRTRVLSQGCQHWSMLSL